MKHLISRTVRFCTIAGLLAACAPPPVETPSQAQHAEYMRMGSHGMAVIGTDDLLLVHMALYRRPHDRQILTPASFQSPDDKMAYAEWRASHDGLVSIVPETFDLDRLSPDAENPILQFTADIYDGHFERGGQIRFSDIVFTLGPPILHQPVTEDAPAEETYTYLTHGETAYLVRHIGPRPGKEEIIPLAPSPDLVSGDRLTKTGDGPEPVFAKEDGEILNLETLNAAYLETADFAAPE